MSTGIILFMSWVAEVRSLFSGPPFFLSGIKTSIISVGAGYRPPRLPAWVAPGRAHIQKITGCHTSTILFYRILGFGAIVNLHYSMYNDK
jgi:hypothetical protein